MAIDSPDDRKMGSASAEAHSRAAKAVNDPTFVRAAAQAHGVQPPKTEDAPPPEDVDEDDAPPTDDREAEPAPTPTGDDVDEDEVTDDYDEEETVESDEDDRPKDAPPAAVAAQDDPWSKLPDEASRRKAFNELASKTAAAPAPEPAPTPEPVKVETTEETVRRLMDERDDVRQVVTNLGTHRNNIIAKDKELKTLSDAIKADEGTVSELRSQLKYLEKRFTSDPENYELRDEIQSFKNQIERLGSSIDTKETKHIRLTTELERIQGHYQSEHVALVGHIEADTRGRTDQAKAQTEHATKLKAAETSWKSSFPRVLDHFKISTNAKLREKIQDRLLKEAHFTVVSTGKDIPDIHAWLMEKVKSEAEEQALIRGETTKTYSDLKRKDADQPGPTGRAAAAPARKPNGRYTSRDAVRDAGASLKRSLAR